LGEHLKAIENKAMVTDGAMKVVIQPHHLNTTEVIPPGGIDLNAKNMSLDIAGNGIEMKFDPAMVAEFRHGNFSGIVANIIHIIPIKSALPMMGLASASN